MKSKDCIVSVILPCYNEHDNVLALVLSIHNELADYNHEIIVVDDNSPDGTYKAIVEKNYQYVIPVLRTKDKGLAKSIRCGIENSKGDITIVMDSDFNHQPRYLTFMIDNIKYYDCVSASRFQYGGSMESKRRHYLSWLFNIFTRVMTRGRLTDSLYGFFAIKRDVLYRLNYDNIFWGYGDYCIRLFYYLQKQNISVLQFPAVNGRRLSGESNNRFLKIFRQYFVTVMKLMYKERF